MGLFFYEKNDVSAECEDSIQFADNNGVITRIYLDRTNQKYCVEGVTCGQGGSEDQELLFKKNYTEKIIRENGYIIVLGGKCQLLFMN